MIAQPKIEDQPIELPSIIRMELWWIEQARDNPARFIEYLTDGTHTPAPHQLEWLMAIFDPRIRRVSISGFPGSGKTQIITFSLAYAIGKWPILTHLLVSVSTDQAKERLAQVREIIELSERFRNVFPHIHRDNNRTNTSTHLNIWSSVNEAGKTLDYAGWRSVVAHHSLGQPKDHTLFAAGITSRTVIGKRITGYIFVDDPMDDNNSATEESRIKVYRGLQKGILTRATGPRAKPVVISNRWAETDVSGRIAAERRLDKKQVWHVISTPIVDADRRPTWPKVYPMDVVEEKASEMGGFDSPLFRLSYLDDPLGLSSGELTMDMLRRALPDALPDLRDLVISCDFASTEKKRSDYTVFTAIGRCQEKFFNTFVLGMKREKRAKITDRIQDLFDFVDEISALYGEVSAVLVESRDSDAEYQGIVERHPAFPIKVVKTHKDKETRFLAVARLMQMRRMFFNIEMAGYPALCSEVLAFPRAEHDDICDALSLPFQQPTWKVTYVRAGRAVVRSPYLI